MKTSNPSVVHVVGIGGVGMSALAQALIDRGNRVSGSDRLLDRGDRTPALLKLEKQGVALFPQNGSGVRAGITARVVISSAIEPDNPELAAAQAAGIPSVHRAAELAALLADRRLIAVAGTCGKSTVTAMLGHLLAGTGFDPMVVNGAEVIGWDAGGTRIGSVRPGRGEWAVAEVDESDKSLMAFRPEHAIITNASADHFGLAETEALFADFRTRVKGSVIDGCAEALKPESVELGSWSGSFVLKGVRYTVPMPGAHNVQNAWHAVRLARLIGAEPAGLAAALATFPGVSRRLQRVGMCGGAAVVDDYAHNPEKLSAAWTTLAAAFPKGVCGVWRPHGFGPLRKMLAALAEMFGRVCRPCDRLLLLPVYDAGGTADRSISSRDLAVLLQAKGTRVELVDSIDAAEAAMRAAAPEVGVLATLGARDPDLPRLAERLARHTH